LAEPSETAETLLIRREGNEAVYLNELRFRKNTSLPSEYRLTTRNLPPEKAALGQKGIVEGRGLPGRARAGVRVRRTRFAVVFSGRDRCRGSVRADTRVALADSPFRMRPAV